MPAPGTVRIAVLGDDAAFGWGAEDDQTYPADLERTLNGAGARVEVLNAGVIGTGTAEQALWYDLWVKQFNPGVVVLTVSWNDVDDDVRGAFFEERDRIVRPRPIEVLDRGLRAVRVTRALANRTPGFPWLSQHSQLVTLARQAPTQFLMTLHARAVGGTGAGTRRASLSSDDLTYWRGEIRWLQERLAPSTRLAIVFLPSAESFSARSGALEVLTKSKQIVEALEEAASEDQTVFLNMLSVLDSRPHPEQLYFARDPHPNAAGNLVIAEEVADFLIDKGIIAR